MNCVHIPPILRKFGAIFAQNGFESYLVGGAVRDMLLKKDVSDWDVATNATPAQVQSLFRRVIPTGIEHGTVTVIFMNHHIEVTTFRTEHDYTDGRHPDSVEYAATITEDLSRRDFTMNAIAADLQSGTLTDPFGGQNDIKARIIRTVGNASERFGEDGLRPVRALRFASQLDFTIEPQTLCAIRPALNVTKQIAVERFHDELIKIMKSNLPSVALRLMEQTGVMELFLPELAACRNIEQKGFHHFDVLDHLFYSCDFAPADSLCVRLAGLFHDVGKPHVRSLNAETGVYTFYRHEHVSADMAQTILTRLHFSNREVEYTCHLIKQHMFFYEESWNDAAVRRFLIRVRYNENPSVLADLFALRRADVYGMTRRMPPLDLTRDFETRIQKIIASEHALSLKSLAVNGRDLLDLGIPSGKTLGAVLNELLETVIEDPASNTKDTLLTIARRYYEKISRYS